MPNWSRRQALASVASGVVLATAGCLGGGDDAGAALSQPEYDCSRVDRPEPDAPEGPDALAPASYPGPPDDAGTDAELTEYVSGFEQSYRRNRLIQSRGPDLRKFGFSPRETWIVESGAAAGVAGVQYMFWHETESIHADSGNRVAVYYVDESVAVRAHERGRREDGVEPVPGRRVRKSPVSTEYSGRPSLLLLTAGGPRVGTVLSDVPVRGVCSRSTRHVSASRPIGVLAD